MTTRIKSIQIKEGSDILTKLANITSYVWLLQQYSLDIPFSEFLKYDHFNIHEEKIFGYMKKNDNMFTHKADQDTFNKAPELIIKDLAF